MELSIPNNTRSTKNPLRRSGARDATPGVAEDAEQSSKGVAEQSSNGDAEGLDDADVEQPDDDDEDMRRALDLSLRDAKSAEDSELQRAMAASMEDDPEMKQALQESRQEDCMQKAVANVARHKARKAKVQPKRADGLAEEALRRDMSEEWFDDDV